MLGEIWFHIHIDLASNSKQSISVVIFVLECLKSVSLKAKLKVSFFSFKL